MMLTQKSPVKTVDDNERIRQLGCQSFKSFTASLKYDTFCLLLPRRCFLILSSLILSSLKSTTDVFLIYVSIFTLGVPV